MTALSDMDHETIGRLEQDASLRKLLEDLEDCERGARLLGKLKVALAVSVAVELLKRDDVGR